MAMSSTNHRRRRSGAGVSSAAIRAERNGDAGEPALRHGIAKRRLAREVAVDAAVADAERAGNVHHRGLGQAIPGQGLFGGVENAVGGEGSLSHPVAGLLRSLSSVAMNWSG